MPSNIVLLSWGEGNDLPNLEAMLLPKTNVNSDIRRAQYDTKRLVRSLEPAK